MNNALWSPRGAQARERTHTAGYTGTARSLVYGTYAEQIYAKTRKTRKTRKIRLVAISL